ncbi:ubiquitin conjugation factor E4 A [Neocloeon triangulifer]|uniref:ubiquitin conjugation factor E4 A n=1 Tax=Neocloeon triangulifer TaxID=2078957 RepID=UPI00286F0E0F|nr:ubiquitin conjugation factor E4 A [Neocloeon triangulifer]
MSTSSQNVFDCVARDIFFITTSKEPLSPSQSPLIYVEDVASGVDTSSGLTANLLAEAVLERLLLPDPGAFVVPLTNRVPPEIIEVKLVAYLFDSWQRLQVYEAKLTPDERAEVESIIVRNVATGLLQKELHPTQNIPLQILWLLCEQTFEECITFMASLTKYIFAEEGEQGLSSSINLVLNNLFHEAAKSNLMTTNFQNLLRATLVIVKCNPICATSVVNHKLGELTLGSSWNGTLLGKLLGLSFVPKAFGQDNDIFREVVSEPSLMATREGMVRQNTKALLDGLHSIFEAILRSSAGNRALCLKWLWGCVEANVSRAKLMSAYAGLAANGLDMMNTISDGFALNLELLVLRLCEPFCNPPNCADEHSFNPKILTIDPSFCAVESGQFCRAKLFDDTCLMPAELDAEGNKIKRVHSKSFTFITECFFLAQKTVEIGSKSCKNRLKSLMHEAGGVEELITQGALPQQEREMARNGLERLTAHILCYRTLLSDPTFIELSSKLHSAAAHWIVQVLLDEVPYSDKRSNFAPGIKRDVTFPLPGEEFDINRPARTMQYVPESVVSNLKSFITMAPTNYPEVLENTWLTWPIFTMVVALMGSPCRVKNPHLRGGLARIVESLLPWQKGEDEMLMQRRMLNLPDVSKYQRERLFADHPFRLELVEAIVSVFVGIEVTGQDHFEQKFQYRMPLYSILNHIWKSTEYIDRFRELAAYAEQNIESSNPPVFLRFSNLLINDSVFLLDEAILQMAKLRKLQAEKDTNAWENLPEAQRRENMRNLEMIGRIARFHNIMSRDTISILQTVTSRIHSLFCHPTMVDRLAAMLNYFVVRLTGPKSKELKVSNMKECAFEPGNLVIDISKIYINLGDSEEFCAAVSRDGRSYSGQLFPRAQNVLSRVGGGDLLSDLHNIAQKVAKHAVQQSIEDELLAEAPDEFLDPITAAIMIDPVILPSSGVSIDRAVIARHLLSDQIDPFNRSPLTMEQVKPNNELREKIQAWIAEKEANAPSSPSQD